MEIPNTHVGLVALSASNGMPLDSKWNSAPPNNKGPQVKETSAVIACEVNVQSNQIPIVTIMTKDGATGTGQVEVTATSGGVALGPLSFDVSVITGTPGPSSPESAGGLTATLLFLQKKPNA